MVVDAWPGRDEDRSSMPQVGEGGRLLRQTITDCCTRLGIDPTRVFYTYAARCRPAYGHEVTQAELDACLPWLIEEIETIKPRVILTLGAVATSVVFGESFEDYWPKDIELAETYSPGYVLKQKSKLPKWTAEVESAVRQAFGIRAEAVSDCIPSDWALGQPDMTSKWLSADTEFDDLAEDYGTRAVGYSLGDTNAADFWDSDFADKDGWKWPHLYLHNIKADADHLGIDIHDLDSWDDTMLMAYVTRRFPRVGLKVLAPELANVQWQTSIKDLLREYTPSGAVFKSGPRKGLEKPGKWNAVPFSRALAVRPDECRTYAATDAVATARIAQRLDPMLDENGGWARLYYNAFEKPLVPVLLSMERSGVRIDPNALGEAAIVITEARARTELKLRDVFGAEINLASNPQMAPRLAELGLIDGKRTDSGELGCAEANILGAFGVEKVEDLPDTTEGGIARDFLEWKYMGGLKSKYIDGILGRPASKGRKEKPCILDTESRIHPRLNQTATSVNRLSSSDPNEQNIPSRPKPGFSPEVVHIGMAIRKAFVPRDGWVFVGGDFSQLQPRWWAHFTGDPLFVSAYVGQEKGDIYLPTAATLKEYGVDRQGAKPIVLGAMYGGGDETLGKAAGVPTLRMGEFLTQLHASMPSLKAWPVHVSDLLAKQGYIESALGWRMFFPDFWSPVRRWASAALREAANAPMIASEAGLVKAFMIAVYKMLREDFGGIPKMVLVVHDELWIDSPPYMAEEIKERLPVIAAEVGKRWTQIPIRFESKIVMNWKEGK